MKLDLVKSNKVIKFASILVIPPVVFSIVFAIYHIKKITHACKIDVVTSLNTKSTSKLIKLIQTDGDDAAMTFRAFFDRGDTPLELTAMLDESGCKKIIYKENLTQ